MKLTKNLIFKNFVFKNKKTNVLKDLIELLNTDNRILNSLSKNYKNSFSNRFVKNYKSYSNVNIIGMGGSILGSRCIYNFLKHKIKQRINEIPEESINFDTEVHNPEDFTADKDLLDYQLSGYGGTDFEANFKWMKDNAVEPKKLIVFTDGYPWGSWGDPDYCDTLWVIHSNHDKDLEAPFGQTCRYEAS